MSVSRIEAHLLPNDRLKVSRISPESREYLLGKGFGSDECLIGKKPSAMPPPMRPVHPLECSTVLQRLWDEEEEIQQAVVAMLEESLEFERVRDSRSRQFGRIDYPNIGVGNGNGQTREVARFDVQLSARLAPAEGHDWAEGYGRAPGDKNLEDLVLPCLVVSCDHKEPWGKDARKLMGIHVHHHHPEEKKNWKNYYKEFTKQHGLA